MDRRTADALDRYITGNYGEDQFKHRPEGDFCFECGEKEAVFVFMEDDLRLCEDCAKPHMDDPDLVEIDNG